MRPGGILGGNEVCHQLRIDAVQLAEETSQPCSGAGRRGATEQWLTGDSFMGEDACVVVGEQWCGDRDRHFGGDGLEQAGFAPDVAVLGNAQNQIAGGEGCVVEAAAEFDDLDIRELRRMRSNGPPRTFERCACHGDGQPRLRNIPRRTTGVCTSGTHRRTSPSRSPSGRSGSGAGGRGRR